MDARLTVVTPVSARTGRPWNVDNVLLDGVKIGDVFQRPGAAFVACCHVPVEYHDPIRFLLDDRDKTKWPEQAEPCYPERPIRNQAPREQIEEAVRLLHTSRRRQYDDYQDEVQHKLILPNEF